MKKKRLLNKGDVIKTNPRDGYWGCAAVLSEREKTADRLPQCHIAITPFIARHDYDFSELDISGLTVLQFERQYRTTPDDSRTRTETLIGVYVRPVDDTVQVIANIDTTHIYNGPLPFEPWYDLEITYPLCGEVTSSLGSEAVISWRRVHDADELEEESRMAMEEHFKLMARLKL